MKFKHSAFIENTPEMREWLEELGYERWIVTNRDYLYTEIDSEEPWFSDAHITSIENITDYVNCVGNPSLFKAVTAISTTTDIGKYYINNHTGQWKKCDYRMATDESIDWNDWSEATLSELKERFNKKIK